MSGGTLSRAQRRAATAEGKRRAAIQRRIRRLEDLFRAEAADPSVFARSSVDREHASPDDAQELVALWGERDSWDAPVIGEQLTLGGTS